MDPQPWTLKHQKSVATRLERGDELLNNGNCGNLLETADKSYNSVKKCDRKLMENDLEAAIRFVLVVFFLYHLFIMSF